MQPRLASRLRPRWSVTDEWGNIVGAAGATIAAAVIAFRKAFAGGGDSSGGGDAEGHGTKHCPLGRANADAVRDIRASAESASRLMDYRMDEMTANINKLSAEVQQLAALVNRIIGRLED